jgi:hypothetical protein
MSGVTGASDVLAADPMHRPDYLGRDVSALLLAHPAVASSADTVQCGRARVRVRGSELLLESADNDGDGLNPLRALAVAAWRASDEHGSMPAVAAADDSFLAAIGLDQRS